MTYRSDFIQAITHQEPEQLPHSIKFTVEAKENIERFLGRPFDPVLETGSGVVASHTNNGWEEVKPGYFKDYFGVVWNKTQDKTLGIVDQPVLEDAEFGDYEFPNPNDLPVYDFIRRDKEKYPDHFHMVSIGFSLFERAWALYGMEEFMMDLIAEPEFIHELLDKITEYNDAVIKNAAALGVDCVHFGDDWGSQLGTLISPPMWREFIKPRFAQSCAVAKEAGLLVSLHCCGNVEDLMDDIVECGVDVFDPFQPEAMDIWKLREKYRNKLAFWGGLSVQKTMPFGSIDDVRKDTEELINIMMPGGGYILSPSHSISGDVPLENIKTYLDRATNGAEHCLTALS